MAVIYETELALYEELPPETYPEVPRSALLMNDARGIPDWIWERIEAYCNWRWTPREAQIESDGGSGWFILPVRPFRVTKIEWFDPHADGGYGLWMESLPPSTPQRGWKMYSPFSHCRITGIVGENNPAPPAVIQAAVRLHAYLGHTPESFPMWATGRTHTTGGGSSSTSNESFQRPANYIAKAMQNSGAADLLRPYRRSR
ncbi:hypothetical protein [Paenirhodobacter sp.]|uniref:hypothetical protein n=1 Tax=Paenirhodobacter sp. TaxID=1965326 RepID=UPI003B50C64E